MAAGKRAFCVFGGLFQGLALLLTVCSWTCGSASLVHVITDENFDQVMEGDWMLEFYAPWCPACKQFAKTWEEFAEWSVENGNGVKVGKVDVTAESGLSGRFMITQLPTIYHIHNGEVRPFKGSRSHDDLEGYVRDEEWREANPVPWWMSPTSSHMKGLALVYWLSQRGKELQTTLEQDYQLSTYAVFGLIAIATIVIGLVLGGFTVCFIELCIRVCSRKSTTPPPKVARQQEKLKKPEPSPREPTPPVEVDEITEVKEQTDNPEGDEATTGEEAAAGGSEKVSAGETPTASKGGKVRKRKGKKSKKENPDK